MRYVVPWLCVLLGAQSALAAPRPDSICALVRDRFAAEILTKALTVGASPGMRDVTGSGADSALEILRSQRADGSWADIPYDNRARSIWLPSEHLRRLLALARAEHDPKREAPDAELQTAVRRGLAYWVRRDPQSTNWWWQTIGTQQALGPILVLARDDLLTHDPATWRAACAQMARSHVDKMTGTNLVWEAGNLLVLGALTDDSSLIARMSGLIAAQIHIGTDEGIQPDFSFHQHGPQLNAGNYGLSFVPSAAFDALLVQATPMAIPPNRTSILEEFEADFQEWVVWGRDLDLSSCGRQLDQPNAQRVKADAIAEAGSLLAALDPRTTLHWKRFLDRVKGLLPAGAGAPRGDKYYWRSDYLVHRPGTWYFSVKMHSPRVLRTETWINHENLRGYHLSDGMTQLMVRGDEYQNIQPVWDWQMLPGITYKRSESPFAKAEADLPADEHSAPYNPKPFVGGAALAPIGVAAMDIQEDGVSAQKAYFCFPDGVICLGTNIACPSADVYTDVNQCLLKGPVVELGHRALWHDGVVYLNLDPKPWSYTAGPRTGSWKDLMLESTSTEPITKDVFNLWIDHGSAPHAGHYAYAMLPIPSQTAAKTWLLRPSFRVISNGIVQAVADDAHSVIAAVFHGPGVVAGFGAEAQFYADRPCIVIARRAMPGHLNFAVADPTQTLKEVRISPLGGRTLVIPLPQGPQAGSTTVATE
jgi:chondroitin AC lyase